MTIEKRLSCRVEMEMPAVLRWRGKMVGEARIENVNLDGMLVCSDTESLHRGAIMDITFEFGNERWRLPIMVVHGKGERHGVMFAVSQYRLYQLVLSRAQERQTEPADSGSWRRRAAAV